MNSSYGKLLENVGRYTETKIKKFEKIGSDWLKNHILNMTSIGQDEDEVMEIVSRKRKIKDDKLAHCGVATLQWSKLLLMEFVYWLEDVLVEGSFKICYLGEILKCL
jgi:hypothetical protein